MRLALTLPQSKVALPYAENRWAATRATEIMQSQIQKETQGWSCMKRKPCGQVREVAPVSLFQDGQGTRKL